MSQRGHMSQNSSFHRLAFCRVGSTWPCVTSLCLLWGRVCIVGTNLKGLFGHPQEHCLASGASNCWSPRVRWLPWWPLGKIPLHWAVFKRLLKIHDVTHHFCKECNRVSHTLLKLNMGVVEEVFICISSRSLRCHVVHTLVSVEIPLGHRFHHSSWHGAHLSMLACTSCDSRLNWVHLTSRVRTLILLRNVSVLWHLPSLWDAVVIWCGVKGIKMEDRIAHIWGSSSDGVSKYIMLCWFGIDTSERTVFAQSKVANCCQQIVSEASDALWRVVSKDLSKQQWYCGETHPVTKLRMR